MKYLKQKAECLRKETIRFHGKAPGTRLASSLSDVEIFTCLYYGGILNFKSDEPHWDNRDRLIVSKAHGAISLCILLAELGFFNLKTLYQAGSQIGDIPDCSIPGIEINGGSLGHGLGIGVGMALGLRAKKNPAIVVVIMGDGELYEGAVWESIMFAGHHRLNNLFLILDNNQMSMLDYCKNTIDLEPLEKIFELFQWDTVRVDGHDINALLPVLRSMKHHTACKPKAIIAETVKGKGVKQLEGNPLCHIISLSHDDVDNYLMST